jgi:hypothetical protein
MIVLVLISNPASAKTVWQFLLSEYSLPASRKKKRIFLSCTCKKLVLLPDNECSVSRTTATMRCLDLKLQIVLVNYSNL